MQKPRRSYKNIPSSFIIEELNRCGIRGKLSGSHYMIVCPFHADKNPSCGVSLGDRVPAGIFHCLACDERGTWNKLANKIGARTWDESSVSDVEYINRLRIPSFKEIEEESLVLSEWNGDLKYKSYSQDFLERFSVKKLWDATFKDWYMYVPITYLGELVSYIKVRLYEDSAGPKYWYPANFHKCLYPVDYLMNKDTRVVVLVEGLGDVYRCLQAGIPALALLGVKVTSFMLEQLSILNIETLILCLDGDEAGKRAVFGYISESGKPIMGLISFLKKSFNLRVLIPPKPKAEDKVKKHDPDSMPSFYLDVLKFLVIENGGKLIGE